MFYTLFWNLDNSSALYNFFVIVKMMPEVSIYYLMAIFRVFLLIIGQKQNFSVIASTKNGIDMKCHDSLKPLCVIHRAVFHFINIFHMFLALSKRMKAIFAPFWWILVISGPKMTQNSILIKIEPHICYVPQKKAKLI